MMEIVLLSLLTFIASFVGTISGFGLSTIMLPIVAYFTPLPVALLFVGIIHFFSDLWKVILFRKGFNKKLLIYFGVPGIITSFLGAKIVLAIPQNSLVNILGVIIVLYTIFITLRPKFKLNNSKFNSSLGGAFSGILAGIFGTGGVVRGIFLSAFSLPKVVYLFSSGAIGIVIDTSRLITYSLGGIRLPPEFTQGLVFYLPSSLLGAEIAKIFINKIPQYEFRFIISIFLFLVGIGLILK